MTREEAWELLTEYNQDEFHLLHAKTVENTMRYFARELGFADEEDFWGIVGLLHDLDFEKYPEEHCIKSQEIMKERGIDEAAVRLLENDTEKLPYYEVTRRFLLGVCYYRIGKEEQGKECMEYVIGHGNTLKCKEEAEKYVTV